MEANMVISYTLMRLLNYDARNHFSEEIRAYAEGLLLIVEYELANCK